MEGPKDQDREPAGHTARRQLAERLRTLSGVAMLTLAGDDALDRARALVEQAIGELSGARRSSRYEGTAGLSPGVAAANEAVWETHAAFGASNPMAPPVVAEDLPDGVRATLTFGPAHEGGPGSVYGGFVAATFDGVLGRAVIGSGRIGVTRSLTVRFLLPTPLSTPLRMEASVTGAEGRDVRVSGRLRAGDRVTAEAEAVFSCVEADRYRL